MIGLQLTALIWFVYSNRRLSAINNSVLSVDNLAPEQIGGSLTSNP
jgi:hypothetical protein